MIADSSRIFRASSISALLLLIASLACSGCSGGQSSSSGSSPNPSPQISSQPTFSSTPPTTASEGTAYSYQLAASAPAGATVSYQLTAAPAGASLSGSTLTWTPTSQQARSSNAFTATAATAGGSATQSWTVTPTGTIRGTRVITYVDDAGSTMIPDNTTRFPIAALVPNGSGGYTTLTGTGATDGTYLIPNVPGGNYLLQSGAKNFIRTATSNPDTGFSWLGRSDAILPTQPTQLALTVTGANPIQFQDVLELYVSNTSGLGNWFGANLNAPSGATSFTATLPWTSYLTDAGKGDLAYVFQMATQQVGNYQIEVLKKSTPLVTFTQFDGSTTPVTAALATPAQSGTVHLAYKGSAFASLDAALNPNATEYATDLYIDVDPADPALGPIGSTPDLIVYFDDDGPISTDVDFGDITYGNPFPVSWTVFAVAQHYVSSTYTAPGATSGRPVFGSISVTTPTVPTASAPLQPIIGPASNITINNHSFFSTQPGVSTTPTVAWSAPALGTPTKYQVSFYRLYADAQGNTQEQSIATFATKGTSLTVPQNLLVAGNSYYVQLAAVSEPPIDISQTPFRHAMPQALAVSFSGVITP